ncbi:nuclear egress membrane protein [Bovine alphaherpesvirus 2]|uniref:Nuclear egress membrane protein n=1 Tax=Bovine alphaherpesvirus 2 TaxID=10295 RepID=A0A7T1L7M7_9ALPH|nr:nuclear egress membrane protein [Bovine alphaherpesvirus 2]
MLHRPRLYAVRRADSFEALTQRIRMVVPAMLQSWECDLGPHSPSNLPSRCIFQFSGQNGTDNTFPIEYVLRLMSDWAEIYCDPYLSIQNTGVSVLFQGFFNRPPDAPRASVTAERNNVILQTTGSAGMSLGELDELKRRAGLDTSPMMASMWISCFVRMPRVQLAFRFMGPEDATRTRRLLCRAAEQALEKQRCARRSRRDSPPPQREPSEENVTTAERTGLAWRVLQLARRPWSVPAWAILTGGLTIASAFYAMILMRG